jgi:hypothetical protein
LLVRNRVVGRFQREDDIVAVRLDPALQIAEVHATVFEAEFGRFVKKIDAAFFFDEIQLGEIRFPVLVEIDVNVRPVNLGRLDFNVARLTATRRDPEP